MRDGPQRLGPWEVLGAIAQGGQGAVLRARDPASGRPVALKVLLRSDAKALRRFRQEAQVLERLDHPGIVRVLGHGDEDGVPWLAMEMIEGEHLRARVDRGGPLEPAEAAGLVATIARAIAHSHERGVVHRDLKPENVIVERATGRAVLVDFGLLRRDTEVFGELSIDAHSRLSKTGELRGTPAFMAPEQISPARFGGITAGTDVYGLGGVLYFLLTGAPPHQVEGGLPGLIYHILETTASPDPSGIRPALPRGLVAEVRRALAPRPADRHASASALADALERVARGEVDPAAVARRRVFIAGLAIAGLVAAAGIAVGASLVRGDAESDGTSPVSSQVVTRTPDGAAERARRVEADHDLEAASKGSAEERLRRARDWLARFSDLPGAARARELLREAGHEAPLLRARHDVAPGDATQEAHAAWVDADRLITWGRQGVVRLWSPDRTQPLDQWSCGSRIDDLAVIGSRALVVVGRNTGVCTLALEPGASLGRHDVGLLDATAVAVAPDGRLAVGDDKGGVSVLAGVDGPVRALPPSHGSPVRAALFSGDGRWLATCAGQPFSHTGPSDNRVVLWDGATLERRASLQLGTQPVVLAFSPDGRWLAAGTTGYSLYVVDLRDPTVEPVPELVGSDTGVEKRSFGTRTVAAHGGAVRGVAFLPDGLLVSGSGETAESGAENGLRAWEPATRGELRDRRRPYDSAVLSVVAAADGRIAVGTASGELTVWAPW